MAKRNNMGHKAGRALSASSAERSCHETNRSKVNSSIKEQLVTYSKVLKIEDESLVKAAEMLNNNVNNNGDTLKKYEMLIRYADK